MNFDIVKGGEGMGAIWKAKREALGMTQKQLADALYVSQGYIGQIEIGLKEPTVSLVRAAAKLFGCTTDELIFGRT